MSWLQQLGLNVPKGWGFVRLSEVADVLFSNVDKHTFDDEDPVRLCNYVDVYKNDRITNTISFMEASASPAEIKRFQIHPGDVLITKDSETRDDIAIPALVSDHLSGVLCGYHLAMIRPRSSRVRGDFLFWLHACKQFRGQFEREALGVTRFGLSQHNVLAAQLPLPPADEQNRIAAFLEASCHAVDAAVVAKRRQIESLHGVLDSLVLTATTRGIREGVEAKASGIDWIESTPAHWQIRQIKRRCTLMRGKFGHRPRNDPALYGGDYPFVQTGDITAADKYIRSYSQTLNEDGLAVSKVFPKGTLVMSIAANVGDVAILDFEACFPDSMIGLVPDHGTDLDFLFYLMRAMKSVLLRSAILTTQLNLNYVRIGTNFAPFPPPDEQKQIAQFLDEKALLVRSIEEMLSEQIETLTAYRKSLIHECVTGQRRITDENVNRVTAHAAQYSNAHA